MPVSSSSSRMPNCETRVEHRLLLRRLGKERVLQVGQQRAQHRRAEQHAGEQLPHDRGLADALHGLAEQPADQHQRDELATKMTFGGAAVRAFGGECVRRPQARAGGSATGGREQTVAGMNCR